MKLSKRTLRIISTAVSLLLIVSMLTSCGLVNLIVNSIVSPADASGNIVDFNSLTYERPDFEGLKEDFEALIKKVESQPNYLILGFSANNTLMQYAKAMDMFNLIQIRYYRDINDTEAEEEVNYCTEQFAILENTVNEFYVALVKYGYSDTLLYGMTDTDFEFIEIRKKMHDEEYEALTAERTRLENEYTALTSQIVVAEKDGTQYSINEYQKLYLSGEVSAEDYQNAVKLYYSELADRSFPIYKRMLEIDNAVAAKAGLDSYHEFAHKYVYFRDFDTKKIGPFSEFVKKSIVPLYFDVMEALNGEAVNNILSKEDQLIENYDSIFRSYAREISPYMEQAYKDMQKYNLAIIGNEDSMWNASFTTFFRYYEMPFMFINTSNSINDIYTFIHEFGHFYSYYYNGLSSTTSVDVAEIQSQANEWLFMPYYDLSQEELEWFTLYRLAETLSVIIEGCLYDEFQRTVYPIIDTLESAADLNRVFKNVAESYQYQYIYSNYNVSHLWAAVHHNFTAPFYYLSYATSAISALEIYALSLEDRDEAIELYLGVCDDIDTTGYLDKVEDCGLSNPFDTKAEVYEEVEELITNAIAATRNNHEHEKQESDLAA